VAAVAAAAKATALGWVAAEHHAAFEELLAEAQTTYQLRDERCELLIGY
jgi:hypothetical protein